jgi:muramoyltetrapeptide carboxypeptidase
LTFQRPRAIRAGDRIAVVAPASPFQREDFDRGVAELRDLGFEPVYDESVFERKGYLAGAPAVRAKALRAAWQDPDVAAVVAVRGGYGSVQVLPLLDVFEARRARKAFIGYSDLTSLLIYLTTYAGQVAFHGPMLAGKLGRGEAGYDRRSFMDSLTKTAPLGELTGPALEGLTDGEAEGPLLGGTLTQILASLGTPFAFDPPAGHILFLDEVRERPYRIDRMLTQLVLAGLLAKAAGIVFGELPSCDEPSGAPRAREVVADLLHDFPGPVLFGLPSGHTTTPALTLPLGVSTRIVGGRRPRVVIQEAAVT